MGLLTGGLSEGLIAAFNRHSKSGSSSSSDDFIKAVTDAVKQEVGMSGDGNPSFMSKMTDSPSYSMSEGNGIADLLAG